jgi:hypothetical protein
MSSPGKINYFQKEMEIEWTFASTYYLLGVFQ